MHSIREERDLPTVLQKAPVFLAWGPFEWTMKQVIVGMAVLLAPYAVYDLTLGSGSIIEGWDPPPANELVLILGVLALVLVPTVVTGVRGCRRERREQRDPMNASAAEALLAGDREVEVTEYIFRAARADEGRRMFGGGRDGVTYELRAEDGRYFICQLENEPPLDAENGQRMTAVQAWADPV